MNSSKSNYAFETFGISKEFRTVRALDNVSLQVPERSIFGFLGPNGAGKSTLIRVIAGLITPTSGSFEIQGVPDSVGFKVRENISALVDRADFYKNLSGYRNLQILGRLTGDNRKDHIDHLLQVVGLYERRNDKVKTYSQGMKQRLGLAQALLPEPGVLILDEPTTGLDPLGMREVRDFILNVAEEQQVTIFLSSHLLHEVEEMCTDIGLIYNGQLAAQGTMASIVAELEDVQITIETDALEKLETHLQKSEMVHQMKPAPNGFKVRIDYGQIPKLIAELTTAGIPLYSVAQRNRLEEIFLAKSGGRK